MEKRKRMDKRIEKRVEKIFVFVLVVAVMVGMIMGITWIVRSYTTREESTVEGLQEQVNAIKQQIAQLQAQLATQASITVLSPNGGEEWTFGTPQTIAWSSTGGWSPIGIDYVDIYLWFPDGATCNLADNVSASQGKYTLTLQENQECPNISRYITAGQYKILILGTEPALAKPAPEITTIRDESDNYFSIKD